MATKTDGWADTWRVMLDLGIDDEYYDQVRRRLERNRHHLDPVDDYRDLLGTTICPHCRKDGDRPTRRGRASQFIWRIGAVKPLLSDLIMLSERPSRKKLTASPPR